MPAVFCPPPPVPGVLALQWTAGSMQPCRLASPSAPRCWAPAGLLACMCHPPFPHDTPCPQVLLDAKYSHVCLMVELVPFMPLALLLECVFFFFFLMLSLNPHLFSTPSECSLCVKHHARCTAGEERRMQSPPARNHDQGMRQLHYM